MPQTREVLVQQRMRCHQKGKDDFHPLWYKRHPYSSFGPPNFPASITLSAHHNLACIFCLLSHLPKPVFFFSTTDSINRTKATHNVRRGPGANPPRAPAAVAAARWGQKPRRRLRARLAKVNSPLPLKTISREKALMY